MKRNCARCSTTCFTATAWCTAGENPFAETDMRFGTRDVVLHRASVRGDTLTAYGENFTPYSVICIDGRRVETAFVSENEITCPADSLSGRACLGMAGRRGRHGALERRRL